MSDDIIKRLRFVKHTADWEACDEAAARLDKAERERDALSAEAANARQLATAVCNALGVAIMHDAPNAIDLLREDAERYRWLRGDACPDHSVRWTQWVVRCWCAPFWSGDLRREGLDRSIDAAMAAERGKE